VNNLYKLAFRKSLQWPLAVLTALIMTGCNAVGPNYVPPDTATSTNWHTQLEGGLNAEEMDPNKLAKWWTTINDPKLSGLIERAKANNLDLKNTRARIRESRARRGITVAGLYPSLDVTGSATWSRSKGSNTTSNLYSANFDAGWEMDIFGGVRRSVEAVDADLQSVREDLHDVLVSLLAEVALNYIDVRIYQARLAAVQASIEAQNETYQLTLWRCQAGLSDDLAVQQARYNLESSRSQIPTLRAGLEEAMNRLAVLLGEQPGKLHSEVEKTEPIPVVPLNVAVGVPADVIRRRPDIRSAERALAAQTARIGVAKASLYPSFTLNGSIGFEALSWTDIPSADWALSGGPRISWPIFDAGAIRQNVKVQSALAEQALIQYEAAVLGALEDVENALVSYAEEQRKRENLREAAQAAKEAAELAQHKYQAGLTDFSDVLDAQRSLLSFQDQLAQSDGAVTSNLIRLYKALGGGWTSLASDEQL
jgi:multidrug efflux system outer membrane protein